MAQNLENHAHRPVAFLVATLGILGAVICVVMFWMGYNTIGSAVSCLVVSVIANTMTSRTYTTTLQDRIIRMEMQYRVDKLLSPAQLAAYATLGRKQIVALRFASDAELPALVERASSEKLLPRGIKEAVTDWQADEHRT
jgi:hypothetical protein